MRIPFSFYIKIDKNYILNVNSYYIGGKNMHKHKTVIILGSNIQLMFDGDIKPEQLININLKKEITEVAEDTVVHTYTAEEIPHNNSTNEGIFGQIIE